MLRPDSKHVHTLLRRLAEVEALSRLPARFAVALPGEWVREIVYHGRCLAAVACGVPVEHISPGRGSGRSVDHDAALTTTEGGGA